MKNLEKNQVLIIIKWIHTIIWSFFVVTILYIFYAGIVNKINSLVWIAIGLVILEGIILLINKWKCPLTILGYNYTSNFDVGFDIYIPKWLAKNNKLIFTTVFIIGVLLVIYRVLSN